MANDTSITVRGWAGGDPTLYINSKGNGADNSKLSTTIVNVGVTPRIFKRDLGEFINGDTAWYSVRCYGSLAQNVAVSVKKGMPVLVRGRLTNKVYTDKNQTSRSSQVILADSLGVDLNMGTVNYEKNKKRNNGTAGIADVSASTEPSVELSAETGMDGVEIENECLVK